MTKKQKLIRNLFILILLVLFVVNLSTASFTPLSAHKRSERTANYGPSTIIKFQRIKGGMLYLCKYDKWYSLNTVRRGILGLWFPGDQVHGKENDIKNPMNYSWGFSGTSNNYMISKFFGIVNDPNIKSVKLTVSIAGEEKTFEQKELYDNMFLFIWEGKEVYFDVGRLMGLDKDSNIIFEKTLP